MEKNRRKDRSVHDKSTKIFTGSKTNKLSPRYAPSVADGSSTCGGSTSACGRVRRLHISGGQPAAGSQRAYSLDWDRQTDRSIAQWPAYGEGHNKNSGWTEPSGLGRASPGTVGRWFGRCSRPFPAECQSDRRRLFHCMVHTAQT